MYDQTCLNPGLMFEKDLLPMWIFDQFDQVEEALRESEHRLELFFSQSLDGFFFMILDEPVRWDDTVDKDQVLEYVFRHQRVTKVNDAMLNQYGARREQFIGLTPNDLFVHNREHGKDLWRRMLEAGRLHVESDERKLDGTQMWVQGDYICFYDSAGRVTGHFGIQRDVTGRKRAEEALCQANRRLESLREIDRAILAARSPKEIAEAALLHIQGLVPYVRAGVVRFGPAPGKAVLLATSTARGPQSGAGAEISSEVFGELEGLRQGTVRVVEGLRNVPLPSGVGSLQAEGGRSYVNVPLIAGGTLIGVLNLRVGSMGGFSQEQLEIAREVADSLAVAIQQAHLNEQIESHATLLEQRVAERTVELSQSNAKLRESEQRLTSIFGSAMDAIVVVDEAQRVLIFNDAAERVFRCRSSDALGRRLEALLSAEFRTLLDSYILKTRSGEAPPCVWAPVGLTALRSGGEEFPVEATVSRSEVSNQNLFTLILRDVTERKQAEEALDRLQRQNLCLQEELRGELNFGEALGTSEVMRKVFKLIELVAGTDSTVLLLGETGTGKELLARAVHGLSGRNEGVLVKVNCGALPAGLVESELFGHEKGAFTGATAQKKGRFELAHQGTLFLDEVGELPQETQVKLLRVLQEQEFERLGGSKTVRVNVRVIAATNRDLEEAVRRGLFRADLFYRLNIFPIQVPPLREREEDIPLLASYFVNKFATKIGRRIHSISQVALDRLRRYEWPGNVRELANILERAVILCQGRILQQEHLGALSESVPAPQEFLTLEEAERRHILQALQQTGGVLAGPQGAAQLLGLNRSTLWSRMKKLGIEPPKEVPAQTPR